MITQVIWASQTRKLAHLGANRREQVRRPCDNPARVHIAGWRKERMPERPRGVIEMAPDWVCEIVSPGHERKDTLKLFLLLQRHRVPFLLADLARGPGLDRPPDRW